MSRLRQFDLDRVVRCLPNEVKQVMKKEDGVFLGGGFIRSIVSGETPSDIDLFASPYVDVGIIANSFVSNGYRLHVTKNAYTLLKQGRWPIQIILRWRYDDPVKVILSFDFTICRAVVFYNSVVDAAWTSRIDEDFYSDLAARRLVYTRPVRNEDAGGSMMRVRKFLKRGYNIQAESLGMVIARLYSGVDQTRCDINNEDELSVVLVSLLREVDPAVVQFGIETIIEDDLIDEGSNNEQH